MTKVSTYAEAGVDRKLEETSVNALLGTIKAKIINKSSNITEGLFAGGIEFGEGILSMATDGVGTKVLLADELGIHNTIGIDCVAMNVNDLLASGSIPIAFVDYIAIREPNPEKISSIVEGVTEGCNLSHIPLVGGETAILPELIQGPENHFDLAGTALGYVSKTDPIISDDIKDGDVIIAISSSGVHSNGFTLVRKIIEIGDEEFKNNLLTPTRIYVDCIKDCKDQKIGIHGMAHITGGGLRNLLRLGSIHFELQEWDIPEIFLQLQQKGKIEDKEMYTTFNMGIGFVIIVSKEDSELTLDILNRHFPAFIIGKTKTSNFPLVSLNQLSFRGAL